VSLDPPKDAWLIRADGAPRGSNPALNRRLLRQAVPLVYLSQPSVNGIKWPRTVMAHTSGKLSLFCELAGQRGKTYV
jgi:hypothetical protein